MTQEIVSEIKCESCGHKATKHTNPEELGYAQQVKRYPVGPFKIIYAMSKDSRSSCSECPCVVHLMRLRVGEKIVLMSGGRMVDDEYYQQYARELADAGHDGLTIMKKMMELIDELGDQDLQQTWHGMDDEGRISVIGMDNAYANVKDLIDLVAKVLEKKKMGDTK